MKQTAVEWLWEQIDGIIPYQDINTSQLFIGLLEQSKEMEKEQIMDAYWGGLNGSINDYSESKQVGSEIIDIKYGKGAEQYYNKTYKSE